MNPGDDDLGRLIPVRLLGQSGCRFGFPGCVVYVDPYLSNSVQRLDAQDLERLIPVPVSAESITDADWVLLTHEHIDHCDPDTLPGLARASAGARFMGPAPVLDLLREWGISGERLHLATESWVELAAGLRVHAVPAAHPAHERDQQGRSRYVGYVVDCGGGRLYLAGDTSVTEQLIECLQHLRPISCAFLPVNEQNFFRARRGIIGNMSVREAFHLADELGVDAVVPVHWDMFAANSVAVDEIRAVYGQMKPAFQLLMQPDHVRL
jgi:L-ascorbate metabolism protein UlaG (beta-lactamase superfamily)